MINCWQFHICFHKIHFSSQLSVISDKHFFQRSQESIQRLIFERAVKVLGVVSSWNELFTYRLRQYTIYMADKYLQETYPPGLVGLLLHFNVTESSIRSVSQVLYACIQSIHFWTMWFIYKNSPNKSHCE